MRRKPQQIPGQPQKPKPLILLPLLLLLCLCGWLLGVIPVLYSYDNIPSFSYAAGIAVNNWKSPFPMIGTTLGFCGWLLFSVKYMTRDKKLLEGKEYGEARFASPKEVLPHISGSLETDKILSQSLHMDTDDTHTGLNASCLLVGGSGSGKSFRYVVPNILQANTSLIITDPKGTLLTDYGNYLLLNSYQVKVININDPGHSDTFNPFSYIRNSRDIITMVNDYIRATTPKNSSEGEVFWKLAEAKLTTALIQLMFVAYPQDRTMRRFLSLVNMLEPPGKTPSELDQMFEKYKDAKVSIASDKNADESSVISGRRAYENYKGIMQSAEDTCRSVIISVQSRYDSISNSPDLIEMLSGKESVDFRALGTGYNGNEQKTALFIVSSDIDRTFAGLVLWVESFLFKELYAAADARPSGRLPIPVQIYLDEFANTPHGENVLQLFATARSRSISISAIIQSMGQLKGLFKDEAENIQGTSDCMIYMGSNEPSVHKEISEQLGKYSIHKHSTSDAVGAGGSNSVTTDSLGKDLMSPDRIRMLPSDKEIILIRGFDPVLDDKFKTQDSVKFRLAMSFGRYDYSSAQPDAAGAFRVPVIPDESRVFNDADHIFFIPDELFSLPDNAFDFSDQEEIPDDQLLFFLKQQILT